MSSITAALTTTTVITPRNCDVLCSNGIKYNWGNIMYTSHIQNYHNEYVNGSMSKKRQTIVRICDTVEKYNGRFLKKDPKKGWYLLTKKEVGSKVYSAFADVTVKNKRKAMRLNIMKSDKERAAEAEMERKKAAKKTAAAEKKAVKKRSSVNQPETDDELRSRGCYNSPTEAKEEMAFFGCQFSDSTSKLLLEQA